jgi:hypothetical protein
MLLFEKELTSPEMGDASIDATNAAITARVLRRNSMLSDFERMRGNKRWDETGERGREGLLHL